MCSTEVINISSTEAYNLVKSKMHEAIATHSSKRHVPTANSGTNTSLQHRDERAKADCTCWERLCGGGTRLAGRVRGHHQLSQHLQGMEHSHYSKREPKGMSVV